MYVIIDNYDSFTYNIYQYLTELTDEPIKVFRNDKVTVAEIGALKPKGIIISPGPGRPEEAGISVEAINTFKGRVPILGVCLGHQSIGYAFGADIIQAKNIVHGKVEDIKIDGKGLFRSIDSPSPFTRYHSLVIDRDTMPDGFEISAWSADGEIMGIRHLQYDIEGVQFHPESIASEKGKRLLKNFLDYKREPFKPKPLIQKIMKKKDLTQNEAENFMEELTEGNLTEAQIAAVLVGLNAKGITPEEIAGCASVLQRKRVPIEISKPVLDTCGTGGDGLGTFNISSFSALIASAAGASVAKHGNRAVSSLSGSADFYRQLGIQIELTPEAATGLIEDADFAFLFAPVYHKAMRHAAKVRKELGIKTIMNLLGPLVNPAGAEYQIIGVFSDDYCLPMARAAHMLGVKRVMVVHGMDGLDEISVSAPTRIVVIDEEGNERDFMLDPLEIGIKGYKLQDLKGGGADVNAAIARDILDGKGYEAIRDAALLNAGAGLAVYGVVEDIKEGYELAKECLEAGKVKAKLEEVIALSNKVSG